MFCFQAEDGIRDLVRSRGLGDVYKRQLQHLAAIFGQVDCLIVHVVGRGEVGAFAAHSLDAVSYTHLTLPTSDLV